MTLTVTNECGVNIFTQVVNVIFAPQAGFNADNREGCGETITVQFFDQSEGQADSWAWTFEGGVPGTSDLQNPSVTYSVPGTYDVQLIA
ncbi:PKD domain-containing protein, partial [Arthrospira platensis SPKY1]|nr:PKD domain-containing protein [Arthrospira platensis SPKY1]